MKKVIILFFALVALNANAQNYTDTFDSNTLGWTEESDKNYEAVIKEGVMHMSSKPGGLAGALLGKRDYVETHCYAPLDVTKNFEIKCEAITKKSGILNIGLFGIMLDYIDDGNFTAFLIGNDYAYLVRYYNNQIIGRISNSIKITDKKQASFDIAIKSTYQKLEFFINNMRAIEARYLPLQSNGFGFYVNGDMTVDFDNVEFIQ